LANFQEDGMLRARKCLKGMVTAPHHLAAEAGARALREGGNAIEAMIAAAATIAVSYPHMNAIGGDGFWLIALPGRPPVAIQGCGPAARLATPQFYAEHGDAAIPARGPRAALTVAGAVAGWAAARGASDRPRGWGKTPACRASRRLDSTCEGRYRDYPVASSADIWEMAGAKERSRLCPDLCGRRTAC